MPEFLKRSWREFRRPPAGRRFRERYERRQQKRGGKSVQGPLFVVGGALLAAAGLFFLVVPGPGIPILLLGAALIAGESLRFARWLDRLDLRWQRWRSHRRR